MFKYGELTVFEKAQASLNLNSPVTGSFLSSLSSFFHIHQTALLVSGGFFLILVVGAGMLKYSVLIGDTTIASANQLAQATESNARSNNGFE